MFCYGFAVFLVDMCAKVIVWSFLSFFCLGTLGGIEIFGVEAGACVSAGCRLEGRKLV